jgi:hypothetical protein
MRNALTVIYALLVGRFPLRFAVGVYKGLNQIDERVAYEMRRMKDDRAGRSRKVTRDTVN